MGEILSMLFAVPSTQLSLHLLPEISIQLYELSGNRKSKNARAFILLFCPPPPLLTIAVHDFALYHLAEESQSPC